MSSIMIFLTKTAKFNFFNQKEKLKKYSSFFVHHLPNHNRDNGNKKKTKVCTLVDNVDPPNQNHKPATRKSQKQEQPVRQKYNENEEKEMNYKQAHTTNQCRSKQEKH